METQKGPYEDYSPSKSGLYGGFHVSLGECRGLGFRASGCLESRVESSGFGVQCLGLRV